MECIEISVSFFSYSDVNRILCNRQTKSGAIADMELNPRLLRTPEFDREYNSPLHTSNLPSARKEHKTPACKSICTFRGTTNKKSHASNLCSLTSSLVKKKKSVGKALQFQSVPRMNVVRICTKWTITTMSVNNQMEFSGNTDISL